ncbi:PTS ascorbate transporter subunit IIC [Lactococcus termiticola]|uniref:Ascorbate-specific PTS system EIIC component n=1 Tax=Lactococcus termiticola TaxID=2169526 RepID=A0A2R5HFX1_9LACT|nr:PTS ascorbate transporter subunit IIC [Lactococcus termiticola]GBG96225.1 ascorbate-specific PTS system IIC component [Lactococcus termiticola]
MNGFLNFIVSFATTPALLVGIIAMLGLILQKKPATAVIQGGVKTFAGFLVLTGGAGILVNSLTPFSAMFQHVFAVKGLVPSNEAVVALALVKFGTPAALIMLVGFIVNIILARITRFKYIFLTGQAMLYVSTMAAVVLAAAGLGTSWVTILLGGIFEGTLLTITPALTQRYMRKITGNDGVAMGHTGNMGYALSGWLGEKFGNKDPEKSTEKLNIPKSLGFLRDSTVSISLVMMVVYIILALLAGPHFVESSELSNGTNYIVYAIVQAGTFAAGFVVVLQGVRMILAEIIPAFQGIAQKLVPNSKPALDVPIVFPYAPNAVLIGFFVSFVVGVLSMLAMIGLHTTVIIPGIVGIFFCGGAAGVYGNAFGGLRGAIIGSIVNGLILAWGPLLIMPALGSFGAGAASTFADSDYIVSGGLLGLTSKAGSPALIALIIGFLVIVLILNAILNARDKAKEK